MDLFCAGFLQDPDEAPGGRAPDDGIVHENDPFSFNDGPDGIQLDPHLVDPVFLSRRDEGAADVLVLDEADLVVDPGRL